MHRAILITILSLMPLPGLAATFCVGTSAELAAALQTAGSNGQNDHIRLKIGSYVPPSVSGFTLQIDEANLTEISGGWVDYIVDCGLQGSDPRSTSIEGNDSNRLFRLFLATGNTNGNNINFTNLSFRNGSGQVGSSISPIHLGIPAGNVRVLFDRVFFWSNTADYASTVLASGLKRLAFRNSVFMFNHVRDPGASATVVMRMDRSDQRFFFINNTMVNNSHGGANAISCSGVALRAPSEGTSPEVMIVNSIFWNNTNYDICLPPNADSYLFHNNYQQINGQPLVASGNLSVDPELALGLTDFTPEPTSPMINAGLGQPGPYILDPPNAIEMSWSYGDHDFDLDIDETNNHLRVIDGQVDIGAVEAWYLNSIFNDRFEGSQF